MQWLPLFISVVCPLAVPDVNPFTGHSDFVTDLNSRLFDKYVDTKTRQSYCVLLITTGPESHLHCSQCRAVEPIFNKMAYNYQQQYGNQTMPMSKRLMWARMFFDDSMTTLPQKLGFSNLPAMIIFKPKSTFSFVRFTDDPGRAIENRRTEELASPTLAAKRKLASREQADQRSGKSMSKTPIKSPPRSKKKSTHTDRWIARLARREASWNALATGYIDAPDDGSFTERNFLRFIQRNTGVKLTLAEDVPGRIKAQKALIVTAVAITSLIALILRLLVFPAPDPDLIAIMEQTRIRGLSTSKATSETNIGNELLPMRLRHPYLPSFFWSFLFLLSMLAFLIVTGGFYYNILHPSDWAGRPQGKTQRKELVLGDSHGQYGIECWLVVSAACAINLSFIMFNTASKFKYQVMRGPIVSLSFCSFVFATVTMWVFFLKKNPHFLSGMKVRDTLLLVTNNARLLIGDV